MKSQQRPIFFKNEFGGSLLQGVRKSTRPFDRDQVMICVLSSSWCKKNKTLNSNQKQIEEIIFKQALGFQVQIKKIQFFADQIHFLYKSRSRTNVARFFKSICGLIARKQAQTEKGNPLLSPFWSERPWTSVLCLKKWNSNNSHWVYDYLEFINWIANYERLSTKDRAAPG